MRSFHRDFFAKKHPCAKGTGGDIRKDQIYVTSGDTPPETEPVFLRNPVPVTAPLTIPVFWSVPPASRTSPEMMPELINVPPRSTVAP